MSPAPCCGTGWAALVQDSARVQHNCQKGQHRLAKGQHRPHELQRMCQHSCRMPCNVGPCADECSDHVCESESCWCFALRHSFIHVTPVAEAHTSHACPSQMSLIPQSKQLIAEQSSTRPTDVMPCTYQFVQLSNGSNDAGGHMRKIHLTVRVRHPLHRCSEGVPAISGNEGGYCATLGGQHTLQDARAPKLPQLDS
jgi:hypothetical protein